MTLFSRDKGTVRAIHELQRGNFEKALAVAQDALLTDGQDFWAAFTACTSAGYLGDKQEFVRYLYKMEQLQEDSPYLAYLQAYLALWISDEEKVLWYWTRIVELPEGWLAADLIEKCRNSTHFLQRAKLENISNFILLPDFFDDVDNFYKFTHQNYGRGKIIDFSRASSQEPKNKSTPPSLSADKKLLDETPNHDITSSTSDYTDILNEEKNLHSLAALQAQDEEKISPHVSEERYEAQKKKSQKKVFSLSPFFLKRKKKSSARNHISFTQYFVLASLAMFSAGGFYYYTYFLAKNSHSKETHQQWQSMQNMQIEEWANVLYKGKDVLYTYNDRSQLIADFNQSKQIIRDGKINQARFLLQRILLSNADFKTKEKSRLFLGFIPDVPYENFHDPINLDKLSEEPQFYLDVLLLLEGQILNEQNVDNGKILSALVRENEKEYLIDTFLPLKQEEKNWLPYQDFKKKQDANHEKMAIFYGKFKGLTGTPKKIYIELKKVWY